MADAGAAPPPKRVRDAASPGAARRAKRRNTRQARVEEVSSEPASRESDSASLEEAAMAGELETVRELIRSGRCTGQERFSGGWTALHAASYYGHLAVVKYLFGACGRVEYAGVRNDRDETALMLAAAAEGQLKVLQYLVRVCGDGARRLLRSERGSALHVAARGGKKETVKWLLKSKKAGFSEAERKDAAECTKDIDLRKMLLH